MRAAQRQDTYDLRDQIVTEDRPDTNHMYASDEEHSVMEDDSDGEERDGEYMDEDDDRSSELSIPNESIDFDLVYALHSFAATVEGQANVVKGDSLFLMDDSNSYWWLVRVLKTHEVGYIPAENIETPFERLARLNKHRNVDLASATQAELHEDVHASRDRLRNNISTRVGFGGAPSPSPTPPTESRQTSRRRSVYFTASFQVHRYPPAVWNEDEEEDEDVEWDDEGYTDEDPDLAEDFPREEDPRLAGMEPDDGMSWEDGAAEAMQAQARGAMPAVQVQPSPQASPAQTGSPTQDQQRLALQAAASSSSQELLVRQESPSSASPGSPGGPRQLDPAQATETRKLSATPTIARDDPRQQQQPQQQPQQPAARAAPAQGGPMLPSAVMQQQAEERKRTREEIEALEDAARKKANHAKSGSVGSRGAVGHSPSSSADMRGQAPQGARKLHKEPQREEDDGGKDKKKRGMLAGLFGRRKDKGRDKGAQSGSDRESIGDQRTSEESGRSSGAQSQEALQRSAQQTAQPQAIPSALQNRAPRGAQELAQDAPQLSQHASTLRQRDQQQQALFQQYLNRSPSSPPEAQPSYGLASSSKMGGTPFSSAPSTSSGLAPATSRPRPGSLVLSSTNMEGPGMPELSVIRVFAGPNIQTEATFKTVLLNASTLADDLVKQAMQRFRLPAGEDPGDYYLTVKQVEGSSAVLRPQEHPLVVFESLVEAAMELPKVKRSSVGSISSVVSNLSMHPAIKKLPMNDFTDDSAVKFYLNRRSDDAADTSGEVDEGDDTIIAVPAGTESAENGRTLKPPTLSVTGAAQSSVGAERFSSPSYRFALQVVIFPEDLPEDMVFDPVTEAIVFKNTLRDRATSTASISSGVSQSHRRKIFMFPKNVTVAEVIEIGLERFGILDGVVDGGDEVEDKLSKRQSSARVRYMLKVDVGGQERELSPSSRVIEAFPRPPTYRSVDRRSSDIKRRSVDFAQLVGTLDDVQPDDPVFVLRRAVAYRNSSSRHRMSAPLDEIALQALQRDIASTSPDDGPSADDGKQRAMTKQEIIAAQRAASRANQRAILSTQTNSARGLDVLLPGNAMLRSQREGVDDRMRYSYVDGAGEMYDISDIVEQEWRGEAPRAGSAKQNDLLEGVIGRGEGLGAKLDRVLSKIKPGTRAAPEPPNSAHSTNSSVYSSQEEDDDVQRTPVATVRAPSSASQRASARSPTPSGSRAATPRMVSPTPGASASRSTTPTATPGRTASPAPVATAAAKAAQHGRQPSIASVLSSASVPAPMPSPRSRAAPPSKSRPRRPIITKDDFGIGNMMAIIELAGMMGKPPPLQRLDPVDEMLFGRQLDLDSLHPDIREIYSSSFKQLDEMDKVLDDLLQLSIESS